MFLPLHRLILSSVLGMGIFFLASQFEANRLICLLWAWTAGCGSLLGQLWYLIFHRKVEDIRKYARAYDGSKIYVLVIITLSCLGALLAVGILTTGKSPQTDHPILFLCLAVGTMVLSWTLVHTQYIFRYAHEYYDGDDEPTGGLRFPEEGLQPDYLDFAYYSFCMGTTFQVSDISITSRTMRWITMVHGLLAFFLNTFVVALTINLVAGFGN